MLIIRRRACLLWLSPYDTPGRSLLPKAHCKQGSNQDQCNPSRRLVLPRSPMAILLIRAAYTHIPMRRVAVPYAEDLPHEDWRNRMHIPPGAIVLAHPLPAVSFPCRYAIGRPNPSAKGRSAVLFRQNFLCVAGGRAARCVGHAGSCTPRHRQRKMICRPKN